MRSLGLRLVDRLRRRSGANGLGGEGGQTTILIVGLLVVVLLLITGTLAVTSAQLARMRLLDTSDAAALAAANALDRAAYDQGIGDSIPVGSATVATVASDYVSRQQRPSGITAWRLAGGTGSPDGHTAVVVMSADVDLPMIGDMLASLGGSIRVTVTSRARADIE